MWPHALPTALLLPSCCPGPGPLVLQSPHCPAGFHRPAAGCWATGPAGAPVPSTRVTAGRRHGQGALVQDSWLGVSFSPVRVLCRSSALSGVVLLREGLEVKSGRAAWAPQYKDVPCCSRPCLSKAEGAQDVSPRWVGRPLNGEQRQRQAVLFSSQRKSPARSPGGA